MILFLQIVAGALLVISALSVAGSAYTASQALSQMAQTYAFGTLRQRIEDMDALGEQFAAKLQHADDE